MSRNEIDREIQKRLGKVNYKLRIAESCKSYYAIWHLQDEHDFLVDLLFRMDSTLKL